MILDISLFLDIISETWLNAWILKQETWLIYLRRIFRELVTRQLDALEWSRNGITRSVLCCLSLSNVCSVIMHSDYTLSWTKCKLFDAGWLGQIVRFWYEFDHHIVSLNCSQLTPFVMRWAFIFINFLTVSYVWFSFSVTLTENLWTFFSRKSQKIQFFSKL